MTYYIEDIYDYNTDANRTSLIVDISVSSAISIKLHNIKTNEANWYKIQDVIDLLDDCYGCVSMISKGRKLLYAIDEISWNFLDYIDQPVICTVSDIPDDAVVLYYSGKFQFEPKDLHYSIWVIDMKETTLFGVVKEFGLSKPGIVYVKYNTRVYKFNITAEALRYITKVDVLKR